MNVFLYTQSRQCQNARNPYLSVEAAVKGARERQSQSLSCGLRPVTLLVVVDGVLVETVTPD